MNPVVTYTIARLGLFVLALAVFALAGAGRLTAVIGAAVVSMLVSYLALRGLRDQVADRVAGRVQRRLDGKAQSRSAEGESEPE